MYPATVLKVFFLLCSSPVEFFRPLMQTILSSSNIKILTSSIPIYIPFVSPFFVLWPSSRSLLRILWPDRSGDLGSGDSKRDRWVDEDLTLTSPGGGRSQTGMAPDAGCFGLLPGLSGGLIGGLIWAFLCTISRAV